MNYFGRISGKLPVPTVVLLGLLFLGLVSTTARAYSEPSEQATGNTVEPVQTDMVTNTTVLLPLIERSVGLTPDPNVFGVQLYGSIPGNATEVAHLSAVGVDWVRWPISWSKIEPVNSTPDAYEFEHVDTSLERALDARVRPIATIGGNPGWAATYATGRIDKVDIDEFVEFVTALVERYDGDGLDDARGTRVDYWEFYNEPDGGSSLSAEHGIGYWGHHGAEYADMLCAVYPAVKAANPDAQVVLGGLAYDRFKDDGGIFVREFLDDVLTAGGGDCFDVMNFHYYPAFATVWAPYGDGIIGKATYLRNKLKEYGVEDTPVVVTEAGWYSDETSTHETQSAYVVKLYVQSIVADLETMIWWAWKDLSGPYSAFGLVTKDLVRKPAYYAYQTAVEHLSTATFERSMTDAELNGRAHLRGYRFSVSDDDRLLYVLWSNEDRAEVISLKVPQDGSATVIDLYGEPVDVVKDSNDGTVDGRIPMSVGVSPIYVYVEEVQ